MLGRLRFDVFSDASGFQGRWAGAYVLGRGGEPVAVILDGCKKAVEAELTLMSLAVEAALASPDCPANHELLIHTDLKSIDQILLYAKRGPAAKLRWLLGEHKARIMADAWNFKEYNRCHCQARIEVGCYGTKHPRRQTQLLGGLEIPEPKL
jgi:hypothetical protein